MYKMYILDTGYCIIYNYFFGCQKRVLAFFEYCGLILFRVPLNFFVKMHVLMLQMHQRRVQLMFMQIGNRLLVILRRCEKVLEVVDGLGLRPDPCRVCFLFVFFIFLFLCLLFFRCSLHLF